MRLVDLFESNTPFTNKTGMPMYDDMMRDPEYFEKAKNKRFEIIQMSPKEYLSRVARGFGKSVERIKQSRSQKLVRKYVDDMQTGDKFPMVTIDYSGGYFGQEGIHRAMAAEKLNIKKMPVMVVDNVK